MRIRSVFYKGFALIALAFIVGGCSSANSNTPTLNAAGKHTANWIVDHRASFTSDPSQCFECHSGDLQGGISRVSCFTPLFNGQACHANGPSGHPAGWRDPALHGADAKSQPGPESGFSNCQACHGADFAGGVSGVSCFTAGRDTGSCHVTNGVPVGAPHSPIPWRTYPAQTHTDTVDDAAGSNASACALCHTAGANLRNPIITVYAPDKPGCFNSTLCHGQMRHPLGWAQPVIHGTVAKSNLTYCQQCHADNAFGGPGSNPRFNVQLGRLADAALGNTGCEVCHAPLAAHPRVLQIPTAFGAITTLNPLNTPWYLHCKASPSGFDACSRCHGANLDGVGGVTGATACTFCHQSELPTTQKNCASCHGAIPNGSVYPNIARAHAAHTVINAADICGECHDGIGSITLDHFTRAKNHTSSVQPGAVVFGSFSRTNGVNPAFNETNLQCSNTYCHGATLVGGTNKSPIWSQTDYLTATRCGTCHGFPPANAAHTGFTSDTVCKNCHAHVNATNDGFDDPSKHVNGEIDVTGGAAAHSFPYPGSVHRSAAGTAPFSGCVTSGCHTNSTANRGGYPVTAGTPPDCQGCHTKAGPGNSCGSCHGTAAAGGRPNGSAFPDVAGRHASPHTSFTCSTCHGANGTGNTSHGPSGGIAHGDANVEIQFTGEAASMAYTRDVPGNGHGNCTGTCHDQTHSGFRW
jgi:predicted CxxxxCH...CXXCH cytochrome family protein